MDPWLFRPEEDVGDGSWSAASLAGDESVGDAAEPQPQFGLPGDVDAAKWLEDRANEAWGHGTRLPDAPAPPPAPAPKASAPATAAAAALTPASPPPPRSIARTGTIVGVVVLVAIAVLVVAKVAGVP